MVVLVQGPQMCWFLSPFKAINQDAWRWCLELVRTEKFGQVKESIFARWTNLCSFHSMGSFIPEQAEVLFMGELGFKVVDRTMPLGGFLLRWERKGMGIQIMKWWGANQGRLKIELRGRKITAEGQSTWGGESKRQSTWKRKKKGNKMVFRTWGQWGEKRPKRVSQGERNRTGGHTNNNNNNNSRW